MGEAHTLTQATYGYALFVVCVRIPAGWIHPPPAFLLVCVHMIGPPVSRSIQTIFYFCVYILK